MLESKVALVLLALQMLFSMITAAIVVNDESDKSSPKTIYGGILITTSLIWLIVLILALYAVYKY
jgi:drug/metabolite transporter superfamily protein YnfA